MKESSLPGFGMMIVFMVAVGLAILPTCTATNTDREIDHMRKLVPNEIQGWKAQDEVQTYDRETIFDYIDGAGEIYLMYDFRKVLVFRFIKASAPTISVELFDMGSSEDAFGIFSHAREGEEQGIGHGSEYRGGVLCFWKGDFLVCITSERETPDAKKAAIDLARRIAEKIPLSGAVPELIDCLPEDGLLDKSVRYFHKHTSLNYHYFVASENILKLGEHTEAILARYGPGETRLLCVRYENQKQAQQALSSFLGAYLPEGKESGIAQIDSGKWVAAKSEGAFLVIVFDAPTKAYAQILTKTVENRLSGLISKERRDL